MSSSSGSLAAAFALGAFLGLGAVLAAVFLPFAFVLAFGAAFGPLDCLGLLPVFRGGFTEASEVPAVFICLGWTGTSCHVGRDASDSGSNYVQGTCPS